MRKSILISAVSLLAAIAGYTLYSSQEPSVSLAAPGGFEQEGGGSVIAVLDNFDPEADVTISYGDAPALTVTPEVKDGAISATFIAPFQSTAGKTTVTVKQGERTALSTIELAPPPPARASVSPAAASMAGGDKVTLRLTNFVPEVPVDVVFGEHSFTAMPESKGSTSSLLIKSEVPAASSPGPASIQVTQSAPNRVRRVATTGFEYQPLPYTVKELVALIDDVGEDRAIRMVAARKLSDHARVTGATEITARVGARDYSFDVDENLGDYIDVEITFSASGIKELGTFETDRDLTGFRVTEHPCLTCKGKGFNVDLISRRCEEDGCRETLVSKLQTMSPEKGTKVTYLCILHAGALTAFAEKANEGWNIVADSIDRVGRTATANRFGDSVVKEVLKLRSPSGRIPRSPYSCEPIVDEEMKRDCPDCSTTD